MSQDGDEEIDEGTLKDLVDLGGSPLLEKLIGMFLDQSPSRIDQAQKAARTGDLEGVLKAVHALGSSAGALGAHKFRELCTTLEVGCRAKDHDTILRMMPQLAPRFEQLCAALAAAPGRRATGE